MRSLLLVLAFALPLAAQVGGAYLTGGGFLQGPPPAWAPGCQFQWGTRHYLHAGPREDIYVASVHIVADFDCSVYVEGPYLVPPGAPEPPCSTGGNGNTVWTCDVGAVWSGVIPSGWTLVIDEGWNTSGYWAGLTWVGQIQSYDPPPDAPPLVFFYAQLDAVSGGVTMPPKLGAVITGVDLTCSGSQMSISIGAAQFTPQLYNGTAFALPCPVIVRPGESASWNSMDPSFPCLPGETITFSGYLVSASDL